MPSKEKTVQIPLRTFLTLYLWLYDGYISDDNLSDLKRTVNEKFDALLRRELYSKYKTAPTDEEREKARQEYLDQIGMHRDFRW